MAIGNDFTIDYTLKTIKHTLGTTVYDVNALYSWLMDTFDELTQMDDPVPMSAQTPTEYTLINEWFMDDESMKYLKNGAIKTSGYNGKIQVLKLDNVTADPVSSDIGKQVQDDGVDIGELLAYEIDPDGTDTGKWWIRSTSTIADNSVITINGGTGAGDANGASVTGEDLFANVYTLGTIETSPYPQVYIFQAGNAISEWSNLTNWDRGHIDVLIKVKEAGTEIDGGKITVFARQAGDLYDNFEIDLSAGGRNAVPLSTSDDLNEDTGDYYLLYESESGGAPTVGNILRGTVSGATAEIVAVTDWGTSGLLTLRGIKGTFQDGETISDGVGGGVANGTVGDTFGTWDAETASPVAGDIGKILVGATSGAKRILRGFQDDGTSGKFVAQVDASVTGSDKANYYKSYQDNEQLSTTADGGTMDVTSSSDSTTVISGWSDITIAFVNGTVTHGGTTGTFIPGERVTYTGGEAILLSDSGSAVTLGNVTNTSLNTLVITGDISGATCTASQDLQSAHTMDKAFEQQSAYPYDVIVNAGDIYNAGRTLAQVYEYFKFITQEDSTFQMYTVVSGVITPLDGEEYIQAYSGYTPSKTAPFGTFAGGKYFGAQGVWIEGMASDQSYQFTDSNGTIRSPYTSVTIKVTSLEVGDRVAVFRTSAGSIDKSIYTSVATGNNSGDSDFVVQEAIATDTPSSGILRVYNSDGSEERYAYSSWSGSTFTLDGVTLSKNYDDTSTAYVPFLDEEAIGTEVQKVVLYSVDRTVMIRVRKKGILPFETSGTVTTAGLSVAAIRTTDSIVTI
jgi:hypothetical protein